MYKEDRLNIILILMYLLLNTATLKVICILKWPTTGKNIPKMATFKEHPYLFSINIKTTITEDGHF